jgi:hypothetical protein
MIRIAIAAVLLVGLSGAAFAHQRPYPHAHGPFSGVTGDPQPTNRATSQPAQASPRQPTPRPQQPAAPTHRHQQPQR